jgi:hypothetical protein
MKNNNDLVRASVTTKTHSNRETMNKLCVLRPAGVGRFIIILDKLLKRYVRDTTEHTNSGT